MTNNRKIKNLARTIAADRDILYTEALLIAREQVGAPAAHPLIGRNIVLSGGLDHLFRAHRALASIARKAGRTVFVIPDWVNRGEYSTFAPEENVLNPAKGLVEALGKIMAGQRLDDAPEVTIFVSGTVNMSDAEWHVLRNIAVTQSHHKVRLSVYAPNWTPVPWPRVDVLGQAADLIEVRDDIAQVSVRGAETVELDLAEADPYSSYDFMTADGSKPDVLPVGSDVHGAFTYRQGDGHILMSGRAGSGKSASASALVYGALTSGWDVHVVETVKSGSDYQFAAPYLKSLSTSLAQAADSLESLAAIIESRRETVAPQERPHRTLVVVDEFANLMFDPSQAGAENRGRKRISSALGKLARASEEGVTVLLLTQRTSVRMLDFAPGMRDTLGVRALLGKSSFGERLMVLRHAAEAPEITEPATGRGIWESASGPMEVRFWYASPVRFARELAARLGKPKPVREESPSAVRPASTLGETGLPIGVNPAGKIISLGSSILLTKGDPLTPKVIESLKASVAERGGMVTTMSLDRKSLDVSVRALAAKVVDRHDRLAFDEPPILAVFADIEESLSDKAIDELRPDYERESIFQGMKSLRRKVTALVESGPQVGVYVVSVTSVMDAAQRHAVVATPSGTGLLHIRGQLITVWDV